MANGVVTPLPRIVGPTETVISGEVIPAGVSMRLVILNVLELIIIRQTVVSMGASILHRNPDIFPDPLTFNPERWLQSDSADLEKYLVSFSKGPRSCLGIK